MLRTLKTQQTREKQHVVDTGDTARGGRGRRGALLMQKAQRAAGAGDLRSWAVPVCNPFGPAGNSLALEQRNE